MSTPRSDGSLITALWVFLKKDLWLYGVALALAPITAAAVVIQPLVLQRAIDDYITPGDLQGLQTAALVYLAITITGFSVRIVHQLALSYAAMRTITRVRAEVYRHTLRLSARVFDREPTGRLLTRATSDVEALGETLTAGAITIVIDVLQVIGVLAAMFWMDAELTLTLALVAPVVVLVVEVLRRILRKLYVEVRTSLSELNAFLSERLDGVKIIQLYSDETRTMGQFDERLERYRSATVRTNVYDALLYATIDGLSSITMAVMLWYGSGGILKGALTAGILAAFIDYIARLFRPIQEFSQKVAVIQRAIAALQKIFSLLDTQEFIEGGNVPLPDPLHGAIQFEGVDFAYSDDGPTILKGIHLQVGPGETVALVGRTGSGKSTLGRLLTRMYDGWDGDIYLDGQPLQSMNVHQVRKALGAVTQDVQLFPGTVRFNLTLGANLSDEVLKQAIHHARADEAVRRLGGLDGLIREAGGNLSAGEAQLLSIARILAHDPPVVLFDEATANVDSLTEARLKQATDAVLEGRTTLIIAHRLTTILHADRICVLEQGRLIESGTHRELLAMGGAYADLFHQQFAEDEGGPPAA